MSTDHGSPPLPPEPETPAWLTLVGAALFLCLAAWWVASQPFASHAGAGAASDAGAPRGAAEH
jgi:hypothetical protein